MIDLVAMLLRASATGLPDPDKVLAFSDRLEDPFPISICHQPEAHFSSLLRNESHFPFPSSLEGEDYFWDA